MVLIAPTNNLTNTTEQRTLTGNAGASSFVITAGLTNSKLGTAPLVGHVGLMTRNVIMRATNSSFCTFWYMENDSVIDCDWTEFQYLGNNSAAFKNGIVIDIATGSAAFSYCSFHEFNSRGITVPNSGNNNFTIEHSVLYKMDSAIWVQAAMAGTNWKIDDNIAFGPNLNDGSAYLIHLNDVRGVCTNNVCSGSSSSAGGFYIDVFLQMGLSVMTLT